MARTDAEKGTMKVSGQFLVKAAGALDPRTVVNSIEELYSAGTWPSDGGTLYIYNGLVVAVTEAANRGIYMLVDKTKYNTAQGWQRLDADAEDILKDGMLETVELDRVANTLKFTWNTAAGKTPVSIPLSDFAGIYTAGEGITIGSDNSIKVNIDSAEYSVGTSLRLKIDSLSEKFTVGPGLKLGSDTTAEVQLNLELSPSLHIQDDSLGVKLGSGIVENSFGGLMVQVGTEPNKRDLTVNEGYLSIVLDPDGGLSKNSNGLSIDFSQILSWEEF